MSRWPLPIRYKIDGTFSECAVLGVMWERVGWGEAGRGGAGQVRAVWLEVGRSRAGRDGVGRGRASCGSPLQGELEGALGHFETGQNGWGGMQQDSSTQI